MGGFRPWRPVRASDRQTVKRTHSGGMEWNDPVQEALCKMLSLATFHRLDRVAQLAEQRTFKGLSSSLLGPYSFPVRPPQSRTFPSQLRAISPESAEGRRGRLGLPARVAAANAAEIAPLPEGNAVHSKTVTSNA